MFAVARDMTDVQILIAFVIILGFFAVFAGAVVTCALIFHARQHERDKRRAFESIAQEREARDRVRLRSVDVQASPVDAPVIPIRGGDAA